MIEDRLTPQQRAAAENIETAEEALAFVKNEGIELTDEDLDQISGGWKKKPKREERRKLTCPSCQAHISVPVDAVVCPNCNAAI